MPLACDDEVDGACADVAEGCLVADDAEVAFVDGGLHGVALCCDGCFAFDAWHVYVVFGVLGVVELFDDAA